MQFATRFISRTLLAAALTVAASSAFGASDDAMAPANKQLIYVSDQPPVRVVGAPFVPNTNPRER